MGSVPLGCTGRCSQTWAMLIKRVYEVDPLACPKCGGTMKVLAFIEPPQGAVIEKILASLRPLASLVAAAAACGGLGTAPLVPLVRHGRFLGRTLDGVFRRA